jgi:hypothetical protein
MCISKMGKVRTESRGRAAGVFVASIIPIAATAESPQTLAFPSGVGSFRPILLCFCFDLKFTQPKSEVGRFA